MKYESSWTQPGEGFLKEAELDEWKIGDGRPRGASHIENIRFWDLPKDKLEYIKKDSNKAIKANPNNPKNTKGKGNYADQINDADTVLAWRKKKGIKEEVGLEEEVRFSVPTKDGKNIFQVIDRDTKGMRGSQDKFKMVVVDKKGKVVKDWGSHPSLDGAKKMAKNQGIIK